MLVFSCEKLPWKDLRHLRFYHVMIHQITFFVVPDGSPRSFRLLIKNLFGTMSPRFVESCILIKSYISASFNLLETRDVYPEGFRCLTVANKYPFPSGRFQLRPFLLGNMYEYRTAKYPEMADFRFLP